ncbi:metal ABC transporter ATP-binding protein [Rhodovulum sulfidophilum]|uniref:metal ABC transporter ATP-binding protein n=1 Tax=Rhodovulum sulfidophilum TaxID=35806 RepID=UPI0019234209|nr:metal ABC transporter ATP-binding protein [Rhodovulum sulfidophilum]MBL3596099.1 metal ABC transporter ATP-binding protein [Rhodovulum sulfidophilum]
MDLFEFADVSLRIGDITILSHVSMRMEPGEIVTIVGPNGSGKSTLLRLLIGSLTPSEGRISRDRGLRIGYVPQRLAIDPTLPMTAADLLSLRRKVWPAQIAQALAEAGVAGLERREISALSGGQLQRVMLARALLGEPRLLVLDEATQGLDQPGVAAFYRQIEQVRRRRGCGVLMVSHDLHVVMGASDRVICLNGHVCCQGAPHHVASAPEYRALFGEGTQGALALYTHHHDHDHDRTRAAE